MSRRTPERSLPVKEQVVPTLAAVPSRNTPSTSGTLSSGTPSKGRNKTPSSGVYRYRNTVEQAVEAEVSKQVAEARVRVSTSVRSASRVKRETSPVSREPFKERELFKEKELSSSEEKVLGLTTETVIFSSREPQRERNTETYTPGRERSTETSTPGRERSTETSTPGRERNTESSTPQRERNTESSSTRTRPPQGKVRLILMDGTGLGSGEGEIKLLEASSYSELAKLYDEDWNDYVGEFVNKFTRLGNTSKKRVWVLIGRYHEYTLEKEELENGSIGNDINALIFADSLKEVEELLKTHPVYVADKESVLADDPESDVQDMDVVSYIFGDSGHKLAQLCGDLVELPQEYRDYV